MGKQTQEENKSLPTAVEILMKRFPYAPSLDWYKPIIECMEEYRNLTNEPSIDEITRLQNIGIEMANDIEKKRKEIESLKKQLNEPSIQEEGNLIRLLYNTMIDLIRQIPNDNLPDYNLTLCEVAEQEFKEWENNPTSTTTEEGWTLFAERKPFVNKWYKVRRWKGGKVIEDESFWSELDQKEWEFVIAWKTPQPLQEEDNNTIEEWATFKIGDNTRYGIIERFVVKNWVMMMRSKNPYGTWPIEPIK